MSSGWSVAAAGLAFGVSAGLAPGPLLALVISESLQHGFRAGFLVAIAPLITDLPIIAGCLLLLAELPRTNTVLGLVSLAGGLFVGWLAADCFRAGKRDPGAATTASPRKSFGKGVAGNLLNPHPYLFWLTAGGLTLRQAYGKSPAAAAIFLFLFYGGIVGTKIGIAALVGRQRTTLTRQVYYYASFVLGAVMLVFALIFIADGVKLLLLT